MSYNIQQRETVKGKHSTPTYTPEDLERMRNYQPPTIHDGGGGQEASEPERLKVLEAVVMNGMKAIHAGEEAFTEIQKLNIVVDPEFESLCPKLHPLELELLCSDIRSKGVISPIVIWPHNGENIILDGHNRYRFCLQNKLNFPIHELPMDTREKAMEWIISHQLGRRNLSPDAARLLRGKLYNSRKKEVPNPDGLGGKSGKIVKAQNDPQQSTAEIVAKETGVSASTVKRDAKYAEDVEARGLTADVMAGKKVKLPKKEKPTPPISPTPEKSSKRRWSHKVTFDLAGNVISVEEVHEVGDRLEDWGSITLFICNDNAPFIDVNLRKLPRSLSEKAKKAIRDQSKKGRTK